MPSACLNVFLLSPDLVPSTKWPPISGAMLMEKIVLPFKRRIVERRLRHRQRHSATAIHLSLDIDP